jgi:hypothetical protein
LIPIEAVQLRDWEGCLVGNFPGVWLYYSDILARSEGHTPGTLNELGVEDGEQHIFVSDRPTTIREYEPEEIEALRKVIGQPKQFFAVDYTDEGLLRRVLAVLLQHEGTGRVVVEDEQGNLAFLEEYLAAQDQ